jgi:hypothetical protein
VNSKNAITQYSRDTWRQGKKRGAKTKNAPKERGGEGGKKRKKRTKERGKLRRAPGGMRCPVRPHALVA